LPTRPDPAPADALVRALRATLATRGGDPAEVLVHEEALPARPPTGEVLRPPLPKPLGDALRRRGFTMLYQHQVVSIRHARAGENVVVTTPTASGKTLCFNLPVIERAIGDPGSRALYLYPTKALASDQLRGLESLLADVAACGGPTLRAARLDGDVEFAERDRLRADPPSILLANPDIVHHDVLYRHRRWGRFLASLRFVVLDELHAYRGVFGAHVALILRRLLRLAEAYGARPVVVAASATIGNPAELAERLTGREFAVVAADGAGSCARRFVLWRPARREGQRSRSALTESVALFGELLRAGRTVILFGQSRVAVERMLALARQDQAAPGRPGAP
jgi:DEAD/DEAH box helicase domain-containing protein